MSTRARGTCLTLVALVAVLAAAGCGQGAVPQAASAAAAFQAGWLDDAVRAVNNARRVARAPAGAGTDAAEVGTLARSLDDVIARAPGGNARTAEVSRALDDLARARTLQQAVAVADREFDALPAVAARTATAATNDAPSRAELSVAGREILQDAVCDAAADLLLPEEETEIAQQGWKRYVPDAAEPVVGAFINYGQRRVAQRVGQGAVRLVAWAQWGSGIAENAPRSTSALVGVVETPDGTRTNAYVHYVRRCLAVPR